MSFVSVIIPNYNHAAFLRQRIDSVINQSYTDIEVIILDDASTDNSREIIEEYRSHEKVASIQYNETNSGSTFKQWKKGIELSKGEWIWIAESDDFCELDLLKRLIDINDESVIRMVGSKIVDENGELISTNEAEIKDVKNCSGVEFIAENMIRINSIPNSSAVIFKKSVGIESINAAIEYKLNGDWRFWIEVLLKGNISCIKEPLNAFRTHSETTRSRTVNLQLNEYLKIAKHLVKIGFKGKVADRLAFIYRRNSTTKKERIAIRKQLFAQKSISSLLKLIIGK